MSTVKIIKNSIVNVNGREYTKGMTISGISNELAAHLVEQAKVAEFIDAAPSLEKPVETSQKNQADSNPDETELDPAETKES